MLWISLIFFSQNMWLSDVEVRGGSFKESPEQRNLREVMMIEFMKDISIWLKVSTQTLESVFCPIYIF